MEKKTITHYNPFQIFFRDDEAIYEGETYICFPPSPQRTIINIPPSDSRYWKRKYSDVDKKLREINYDRVKNMQLGEVVDIIVLPATWDETFREQVAEKYFELAKN